jgi:hypothetical protein
MIIVNVLPILAILKKDVYTQSLTAMITTLVPMTLVIARPDVFIQILQNRATMTINAILIVVILHKVVYLIT